MTRFLFRSGLIAALLWVALGPTATVAEALRPAAGTASAPQTAVTPERIAKVEDLLQIGPLFEVMAEEGRVHGRSVGEGSFPGRDGAAWQAKVAQIYDPAAMRARFSAAFAQALSAQPEALDAAEDFFGSAQGARIAGLELEARRLLLDPAREEAAEVAADKMREARDPRLALLRRLIEAGDMVETNVAGSLTGLVAFNTGMAQAMPAGQRPDPLRILEDLRGQEGQIRSDTAAWLLTYMGLAYAPLPDADLAAYAAFGESPGGKALTGALFAGLDAAFTPALHDLGFEAGRVMMGQDI